MIAKTPLENDSLPLAIWHFVVDQPADRQSNAAEDQQSAKRLEDQTD